MRLRNGCAQQACGGMNCGSRKAELNPRRVRSLNDNGRAIEIAVSGPFIANNLPTMLGAAVEGMGLAQVPAPLATDAVTAGKLVRVLEQFAPMTPGVFLYYPGHGQTMPKLRAFIVHVKRNSGVADKRRRRPNRGSEADASGPRRATFRTPDVAFGSNPGTIAAPGAGSCSTEMRSNPRAGVAHSSMALRT